MTKEKITNRFGREPNALILPLRFSFPDLLGFTRADKTPKAVDLRRQRRSLSAAEIEKPLYTTRWRSWADFVRKTGSTKRPKAGLWEAHQTEEHEIASTSLSLGEAVTFKPSSRKGLGKGGNG